MFHIILYQPEIPPNTGNIIRLAANTGCQLHLIAPLGFDLDDKRCRRAGLDYHEWARVTIHDNLPACLTAITQQTGTPRVFACTSKGDANYAQIDYQAGDAFLFGPETRGLPEDIKADDAITAQIRIPMQVGGRSLNLSNATAVIVYEAWRQCGFD